MKSYLAAAAALALCALLLQGCFNSNSQDTLAGYTPYPKWNGQPYAYAPYDPYGTYYYQPYQYPYPYYYEGYYEHDCGDVPCSGRPKYLMPPLEAKAEPVTLPAASSPAAPVKPPAASSVHKAKP